jgi:hypothetical protein
MICMAMSGNGVISIKLVPGRAAVVVAGTTTSRAADRRIVASQTR